MKTSVEVQSRDEARAVQAAMSNPEARAFVIVVGTLLQLESDRARRRVLLFVSDRLAEEAQQ